ELLRDDRRHLPTVHRIITSASPPRDELYPGPTQFAVAKRLKSAGAPWTFFCAQSKESITAVATDHARVLFWNAAKVNAILFLVALTAGIILTNRALRPIKSLAGSMAKFGAGDWHSRVTVRPGGDELAQLGEGFNAMAERLESTVASLNRAIAAQAVSE